MRTVLITGMLVISLLLVSSKAFTNNFDLLFMEFDARQMNSAEKRLLQTGLALEGHYVGLIDGSWGKRSQMALEDYSKTELSNHTETRFYHAFILLLSVVRIHNETGWDDKYISASNLSIAAPWKLLKKERNDKENEFEWSTNNNDLKIQHFTVSERNAIEIHNSIKKQHAISDEPYILRLPNLLVTKVSDNKGNILYLRTDKTHKLWSATFIRSSKEQKNMLNAISSSIHYGAPRSWDIPKDSLLDRIMKQGFSLISKSNAETEEPHSSHTNKPSSTNTISPTSIGTAFYINNTDLVTAEHIISQCTAITLSNGIKLNLISSDKSIDLAVLNSPIRSHHWLPLSMTGKANLGEQVYALGYPYYMLTGTSLNLTSGNVSALAGYNDNHQFISISVPVQPGNSGGPLLNKKGEILGVISSRLSAAAIAKATGSLPQNINYAVTGEELINFLRRSRVLFPSEHATTIDLTSGIPEVIQKAVTPVFCW